MRDIAEEMGKLFYQNICGKEFVNEENLDIVTFLNNESIEAEKEKNSNTKKDSLNRIASCIGYIELFEKEVFKPQKENKKRSLQFTTDEYK